MLYPHRTPPPFISMSATIAIGLCKGRQSRKVKAQTVMNMFLVGSVSLVRGPADAAPKCNIMNVPLSAKYKLIKP